MRIQRTADDQAQAVGDECDHVMVFENIGVLLEERAFFRLLDVGFDGQQAFLAHLHQDVVDQFEQVHVFVTLITRALGQSERLRERLFGNLGRVADHERAECGAADHDDFAGVPEGQQMTARPQEAAENAGGHHH